MGLIPEPRFKLGTVHTTPGVRASGVPELELARMVARHSQCDWGELDDEDKALNDTNAPEGGSLLSAYSYGGVRIWIETIQSEGITVVLLPDEH